MAALGERLRDHWLGDGGEVRPGASESAIAAFEAKYQVILPADLRGSLVVADGLVEAGRDWYRFHSVTEFELYELPPQGLAGIPPGSSPFVFADYMIWCYGYVIALSADASAPSPVLMAAASDHLDFVAPSYTDFAEAYLEYPDNVAVETVVYGWPPLMCAARNGDVERVRSLLAKGADPNLRSVDGETALHWATKLKHKACAVLIENAGGRK